jgi:hypothetical protein
MFLQVTLQVLKLELRFADHVGDDGSDVLRVLLD